MDRLKLLGLAVDCILGDLPEERTREQRISLDVTLELDLSRAAQTDALNDTVDYSALVERIQVCLKKAKCRLIERAADLVAQECLQDKRITRVTVALRKLGSVLNLSAAEVEITRS